MGIRPLHQNERFRTGHRPAERHGEVVQSGRGIQSGDEIVDMECGGTFAIEQNAADMGAIADDHFRQRIRLMGRAGKILEALYQIELRSIDRRYGGGHHYPAAGWRYRGNRGGPADPVRR